MCDTRDDADDEVERMFAIVRERYGSRLTRPELDELHNAVKGIVRAMRTLRSVKLDASVEPFSPFAPYRADS
jgi:hypothetical protein